MFLLTFLTVDENASFWQLSWRLFLLGAALGAVITPMTATAVASVPFRLAGMAAAGNNAFRQVGGALGPAVLGVILGSQDTFLGGMHLALGVCSGLMFLACLVAVVLLPGAPRPADGGSRTPAPPRPAEHS